MRKIKKFFICLILCSIMIFAYTDIPTIADFGDFESYDSRK